MKQVWTQLQTIPLGDLFMGMVQDSATGRCYPTVMLRSPFNNDEEVPITTMLKRLGIDIPEILQTVAQFED